MDGDTVLRNFALYNCIPMTRGDAPPPPKPPSSFGKPSPEESRRDRIAIAAMQGLLSGASDHYYDGTDSSWDSLLAERAYNIADKMIAARGRR